MTTYADLKKEFTEWIKTNKDVKYLWELNKNGQANFETADLYAKGIASKWSELLINAYGTEIESALVDEIADDVARAYKKAYSETAYYSKNVQKAINTSQGIGMNALEPALDDERIQHLIEVIEDDPTEAMAEHLLAESALESVTRTAVADTIQANARIQQKAGLHAYIERDAGAGCCNWCSSVAGKYEYGDQPDDFWRVHAGCTCHFVYKPSRYEQATRIRYETNNGRLTKITT